MDSAAMAERPVFVPVGDGPLMVRTQMVDFQWFAGMAVSQKQKSIASLHQAAIRKGLCNRPLEVSSKSPVSVGVALSAFNLGSVSRRSHQRYTVETVFQSSKVFENGGPYRDLLYGTSRDAKKDPRIQQSGRLVRFDYFGTTWDLEPKTAFYDWLYINTLMKNRELLEQARLYDAFTDIEFNPERSINCQAYSLALAVALEKRGLLSEALTSKRAFLGVVGYRVVSSTGDDTSVQQRLV
jgi:hypothetical protein